MSLQLLSKINDRYQMAVSVHRELADLFWLIYIPGYAMQHEYQYLDESCTQRKLKRYITSTYHVYATDKLPKTANICEPLLAGKNRKQLKMDDSWKTIKEAFKIYQKWEEETLQEYNHIAAEILANGETSVFNFVGDEIIKDVKAELDYLNNKIIELNAMNWDIPQIVAEQPAFYERFEYLIKTMFGESEKFHYWNSARDPQSRVFFKKNP